MKLCKCLNRQKYLKIMSCVYTPGYKWRLVTHQFTFFPRRRLIRCSRKCLIEQEATLWLKCQTQLKWKEDLSALRWLLCCVFRGGESWFIIDSDDQWFLWAWFSTSCVIPRRHPTSCPVVIFLVWGSLVYRSGAPLLPGVPAEAVLAPCFGYRCPLIDYRSQIWTLPLALQLLWGIFVSYLSVRCS